MLEETPTINGVSPHPGAQHDIGALEMNYEWGAGEYFSAQLTPAGKTGNREEQMNKTQKLGNI